MEFDPESPLAKFIDECKGVLAPPLPITSGLYHVTALVWYLGNTPEERAKLLETTPLFEKIHESAASSGQSTVRPQDLDTNLHFTCFIKAPPTGPANDSKRWRLIELDGGRIGPIDRGECSDLLKACSYPLGYQRRLFSHRSQDTAKYVKEFYVSHVKSINFNMMALCPGPEEGY